MKSWRGMMGALCLKCYTPVDKEFRDSHWLSLEVGTRDLHVCPLPPSRPATEIPAQAQPDSSSIEQPEPGGTAPTPKPGPGTAKQNGPPASMFADAQPAAPGLDSTTQPCPGAARRVSFPRRPPTASGLDFAAGRDLRDCGRECVALNGPEFQETMRAEAARIVREQGCVTADDLRVFARRRGIVPHHQNAWGAIFRGKQWVLRGYRLSSFETNHARRICVWSLRSGVA